MSQPNQSDSSEDILKEAAHSQSQAHPMIRLFTWRDTAVLLDWLYQVLEFVDAVRARHVTPDISVYCTAVAEPYFVGFRSA